MTRPTDVIGAFTPPPSGAADTAPHVEPAVVCLLDDGHRPRHLGASACVPSGRGLAIELTSPARRARRQG